MHNGLILFNSVKGYIIIIIIWFPNFQKDRSCDCRSLTARRPHTGYYWCANNNIIIIIYDVHHVPNVPQVPHPYGHITTIIISVTNQSIRN